MPSLRVLAALVLAGCGGSPRPAALRFVGEPSRAHIYIDGHYAGSTQALSVYPKILKPGEYCVTIESDGYFPHDLVLDAKSGITTVRFSLRPVPP